MEKTKRAAERPCRQPKIQKKYRSVHPNPVQTMAGPKPVSAKAQRRRKAQLQASDPEWRNRALSHGIPERWIDLRKEVCGKETHILNFVQGLYDGEEGDNSRYGDAILKACKAAKLGRPAGALGKRKRSKMDLAGADILAFMAEFEVPSQPPTPEKKKKKKKKTTAGPQHVSAKEQRRHKAQLQASDPEWRARAVGSGLTLRDVDLRKEVCALPTHGLSFVIGVHAGEEGDNTKYGDAIPKACKTLKLGRPAGSRDSGPRNPFKRSRKKARAGAHTLVRMAAALEVPSPQKNTEAAPKDFARSPRSSRSPSLSPIDHGELLDSLISIPLNSDGTPLPMGNPAIGSTTGIYPTTGIDFLDNPNPPEADHQRPSSPQFTLHV